MSTWFHAEQDRGAAYHINHIPAIPQLSRRKRRNRSPERMPHRNNLERRIGRSSLLHSAQHLAPRLGPAAPEARFAIAAGADVDGREREFGVGDEILQRRGAAERDDDELVRQVCRDVTRDIGGELVVEFEDGSGAGGLHKRAVAGGAADFGAWCAGGVVVPRAIGCCGVLFVESECVEQVLGYRCW